MNATADMPSLPQATSGSLLEVGLDDLEYRAAWAGLESSLKFVLLAEYVSVELATEIIHQISYVGHEPNPSAHTEILRMLSAKYKGEHKMRVWLEAAQSMGRMVPQCVFDWIDANETPPSQLIVQTAPPRGQVEAPSQVLVAESKERQNWSVLTPRRYSAYRPFLHKFLLAEFHNGKLRRPTARDVLEALKSSPKPPEICDVMSDGLKYYDHLGQVKELSLHALKEAIARLTKVND